MQPLLTTERLELRRLTLDDAVALLEMNSDPEVMRYLGPQEWSLDSAVEWILMLHSRYYSIDSPYGYWAIHLHGEDELLGWAHLRPDRNGADDIQLGYRLKFSAWGRGYATEVSKALVRYGFDQLGLKEITATTHSENLRSQNVLLKIGMQQVGTFFHKILQIEVLEYSIQNTKF